jgi:hypothetical protein
MVDVLAVHRGEFQMQRALVSQLRPLMIEASQYDTAPLLAEWAWLVPDATRPLFLSAFGDWVFGDPDGSIWLLSVLEGTYVRIARTADDYNHLSSRRSGSRKPFFRAGSRSPPRMVSNPPRMNVSAGRSIR